MNESRTRPSPVVLQSRYYLFTGRAAKMQLATIPTLSTFYLKLGNHLSSTDSNNHKPVPFTESSYLFQQLCQGGFLAINGPSVSAAQILEWLGGAGVGTHRWGTQTFNLSLTEETSPGIFVPWSTIQILTELLSSSELPLVLWLVGKARNEELWEEQHSISWCFLAQAASQM